jgi:hypothetical protein
MTKNTALAERKALVLFNFWLKKHQNDKRVGELAFADFVELCKLILESRITDDANPLQRRN